MTDSTVRILLVDDDEIDRMAFLRHVDKERLPYRCRTAPSLNEAREILAVERFDVVILDHNLPDGLGFDLLPEVSETPVIFVTGSESPENAVRAMKSGANDYLLKDQDRNYLQLMPVAVGRALEQAQAREQLRESQELFHQSFNEAPNGKAFISPDGGFLRVNRALCEMFGVPEKEFLERGFELVFGEPPVRDCMLKRFPARDGSALLAPLIRNCSKPDGDSIWLQINAALVPDRRHQAVTYVAHVQDITEQRRAEESRLELEEQLHHAQKMEALGSLAGGVAHEFNNVLGIIIGFTELARMELPDGNPARSSIDQVLKAGLRAREIILQILTFSRRQELKRELIRVRPTVEESVNLIRPTLPGNVEIRIEIQPDVPPILGNPTQIHQALMNLCNNAWHAMDKAGGRIVIAQETVVLRHDAMPARLTLAEGEYVVLSVLDNGHGMDDATLNRIFEPFFTTKGPGRGTGLGMPVVHGIMRAHDGAVLVESELGKGTNVYLYFPVSTSGVHGDAPPSEVPLPTGQGQRICFVDDEEPLVQLGVRILGRLGYSVTAFSSPREALAAFRANPDDFDLLITDLSMPEMNGIDLASACRNVRKALPVLLASGFVEDSVREEAESIGVREILAKPLTADALAQGIHNALTVVAS